MLYVNNLSMHFEDNVQGEWGRNSKKEEVWAEVVHGVSFRMETGEILGIVGESGSGKTITALTIAGLRKTGLVVDAGDVILDGKALLRLNPKEMSQIQGREISMIFQEPMTALNPTMKIGKQVEEALLLHRKDLTKQERKRKVLQALEEVELSNPEELWGKYPHELSGGMRQRVMIAAACICRPKLLIADEPTTALDVDTQDAILALLRKLNQKYNMSILFISHNLRVIGALCSRVLVMKDGEIVEAGGSNEVLQVPKHDYTKALVAAIPMRVGKQHGWKSFGSKK